ncbi:deoxyguanosinetriphosphate triphosphohydrolase [Asticcacaulis sp. 201]|uniref:deoxyguanosinetriphosphate triphosphohydrolase n=1 Tax=Asticcacaulis sp. 201 TaxID=3028787 RepID=UPI003983860C
MVKQLASFACDVEKSLGRLHAEADSATRTAYARDRDRIIHSTAFRRLKGKTQVFVANEGDYFRTRLTHSLEVAQIARSLAHSLALDEDLAETIALSHDLGHPPFGHAGEDQLHACMAPWGGFDHNVQTFRVITRLEVRYPAFDGLNLTWETLEGIVKHNGPVSHRMTEPSWKSIVDFNAQWDLRLDTFASLEAQCAAIADDIAYNNHDVDDGLRAELFTIQDLLDVPLIGPALHSVRKDWPLIDTRMWRLEGVRRMIGVMMTDVLAETARRLAADGIETAEDVRVAKRPMVSFSKGVYDDLSRLRGFLFDRMYKHYKLNRTRSHAKRTLQEMFSLFMTEPDTLPTDWYQRVCSKDSETARARVICDYIAGMTDAFAIDEQRRLFSFGN